MAGPDQIRYDIFLSYCSADEELARLIRVELEKNNLSVWFAPVAIPEGNLFVREIQQALYQVNSMVVLFSPAALDSAWVEMEWQIQLVQMARERHRRLIPILIEGVQVSDLPLALQIRDAVSFHGVGTQGGSKLDESMGNLLKELQPGNIAASRIPVPVVVAAMSRTEAVDLLAGRLPLTRRQQTPYQEFCAFMRNNGCAILPTAYAEDRNHWRPAVGQGETVLNILDGIQAQINLVRDAKKQHRIRLVPVTQEFFSEDDDTRLATNRVLDSYGCLMVVDSVSLFHPDVKTYLMDAQLGKNENVSLMIVPPVAYPSQEVEEGLSKFWKALVGTEFARCTDDLHPLVDFGIGGLVRLRRWLTHAIPTVADVIDGPAANPVLRAMVRKAAGKHSTEIVNKIVGRPV